MARGWVFGGARGSLSGSYLSFLVVAYLGTIVTASLLRTVPRVLKQSLPENPLTEFLRVMPTCPSREKWGLNAGPRRVETAWIGLWGEGSVAPAESEAQETARRSHELPHLLAFVGEGCTYCEVRFPHST